MKQTSGICQIENCVPLKLFAVLFLILLQSKGHNHEEVKTAPSSVKKLKHYQGYPGTPEVESSHFIEQSPGYGHPYLPSSDTDIEINHFLWTGDISSDEILQDTFDEESIEGEDGFSITQKIYPSPPHIKPTSVLETRDGTVYTTLIQPTPVFVPFGSSTSIIKNEQEGSGYIPVFPTHDPPASHSQPQPYYESERTHGTGYPFKNGDFDMPEPKFLIRTVLRNDTDLLKRSVDLQAFKYEMENRLTRTYRQAYKHQETILLRRRRAVILSDFTKVNKTYINHGRVIRATPEKENVRVRIHNIRSARPEPEIEILYAVYEDEEEPILATEAVKVINDNVNEDEVALILGHPLKIQAEPYLLQDKIRYRAESSNWIIAIVFLSVFVAILLCVITFTVSKKYWGGQKKHDILISSAGTSKQVSPSAPRRDFCEDGAYTLDRGLLKHPNTNVGRERLQSDKSDISDERPEKVVESGGDTPSLADHSSNNTPAEARKSKLKGIKRRDRRAQRRAGNGLTTSDESEPDSAFPARTPENIKALDDLLEEEVPVPGDSGRGSIYPGHPGWAFLDAPGQEGEDDWHKSAEQVQKNAADYRDTLEDIIPKDNQKRKAKSAKSHIFRKDKVAAEITEEVDAAPARPWSAAEPRWNADRMFNSKQKNWEGLAAGRKHLHHGQLLPGSTDSTDEDNGPRKTCWSEGASPGRPPPPSSMMPDPATPLIQAIRSELRRFQRSQNSGVTIVTDPDLLDKESKA